jgi:hypothetical protein
MAKSVDRFRASDNAGSSTNPLNAAVRFLKWIDRWNDHLSDPTQSYHDIAVRARKPLHEQRG